MHVLDEAQNPIPRKKVFCNFPGILPTHSEQHTDEDGIAEFDDVPVCTVQVYVSGKLRLSVGVGPSDHEDVTVTL